MPAGFTCIETDSFSVIYFVGKISELFSSFLSATTFSGKAFMGLISNFDTAFINSKNILYDR